MTPLPIITRDTAPMQLSDFMNLPAGDQFEEATLFYYEIEEHGEHGIKLVKEKSAERFILLKEALMEAKQRDEDLLNAKWGSYLEFGVSSGRTLNFIAAIANNTFVYGFESGNGIGENEALQERPFAYTKTIDKESSIMNGTFGDEYGPGGKPEEKEGLIKLVLKPRTKVNEVPFIPFTPLSNVLLYLGDIEKTLPAYINQETQEIEEYKRTDHVSFIFIDTNNAALTNYILHTLAGLVLINKTIVVTDHQLNMNTVYKQMDLPSNIKKIKPLTQDTVDLRLDYFVQTPKKTVAKAADADTSGRNVLHFNAKNRLNEFRTNESMSKLRKKLEDEQAEAFMSDSEVLQHSIKAAREKFADEKEKGKTIFYLEFGVCTGRTINFIASQLENKEQLFGFEAGTGLPIEWRIDFPKGLFRYTKRIDTKKEPGSILLERIPFTNTDKPILHGDVFIPFIPHERVNLVMGLLEDTLDGFIAQYLKPLEDKACVAFIHVDTDLESAAKAILTKLSDYIIKNQTVVLFDEAFNFDGKVGDSTEKRKDEWIRHEYQALNDCNGGTSGWCPIAYNQNGQQMAVIFND